jgi:hypothetical protein
VRRHRVAARAAHVVYFHALSVGRQTRFCSERFFSFLRKPTQSKSSRRGHGGLAELTLDAGRSDGFHLGASTSPRREQVDAAALADSSRRSRFATPPTLPPPARPAGDDGDATGVPSAATRRLIANVSTWEPLDQRPLCMAGD